MLVQLHCCLGVDNYSGEYPAVLQWFHKYCGGMLLIMFILFLYIVFSILAAL